MGTCQAPGYCYDQCLGQNIVLIRVALAIFSVPASIFVYAPSIVFCLCLYLCMLLCFLPLKIKKKKEQKSKPPSSNILPMNFTSLELGLGGHILYELYR